MATNRITVTFNGCTPAPENGYSVMYRPIGSSDPYRDGGNFTTSPALIDDINDAANTQYEGYVRGDCGGGSFGPDVIFSTV